jgi:hypothetical protein
MEDFLLDDQERKEIYAFRRKRREEKNNPPLEKSEKEKIVDDLLRKKIPSYYEWQEHIEKAADSSWFALSELNRFKKHCNDIHGIGKACDDMKCLEDFTREDAEDYMTIVMKSMREFNKPKE